LKPKRSLADVIGFGFIVAACYMLWISYWNFEEFWNVPSTFPRLEMPPLGWTFFVGFFAIVFAAFNARDAKDAWGRICYAILAVCLCIAGVIMYPRYMWTPPLTWIDFVMFPLFTVMLVTIVATAIMGLLRMRASGKNKSERPMR